MQVNSISPYFSSRSLGNSVMRELPEKTGVIFSYTNPYTPGYPMDSRSLHAISLAMESLFPHFLNTQPLSSLGCPDEIMPVESLSRLSDGAFVFTRVLPSLDIFSKLNMPGATIGEKLGNWLREKFPQATEITVIQNPLIDCRAGYSPIDLHIVLKLNMR